MDQLIRLPFNLQMWPFDHTLVGLMILAFPLFKFLIYFIKCLLKHFLTLRNFKERYSSESKVSWAVVTGATDGIGLGFCKALVRLGFNVVLISRNGQKLRQTVERLKRIQVNTTQKPAFKTIVFDFKQSNDKSAMENMIAQLNSLDICMLVNNVGCNYSGYHTKASHQRIMEVVHTNCTSMAVLTSHLIRQMAARKRSALINISSLAASRGLPYMALYSATKSFINRLSEGLSFEYPSLDIISLKTVLVQSNMSKMKKNIIVAEAEEYAFAAFKELVIEREAFGMFSHNIIGYLYERFPNFLFNSSIKICLKKLFKRN